MHCHLFVPGFAWPLEELREICAGLELHGLETLAARGRRRRSPFTATECWLLDHFGVQRQADLPGAPYSLIGDGGAPADSVWMRVDPVHLRLDRNRQVLADCTQFVITALEAAELTGTINRHFNGRLALCAVHPHRWYAELPLAPAMQTVPPSAVRGRSIETRLPSGSESMKWRSLVNEVQMLLHGDPVNQTREASGRPPVNSVWPWGAGALAATGTRTCQFVAADDPLPRGLARHCGAQAQVVPPDAQQWLAAIGSSGIALAVLDALDPASCYAERETWRQTLQVFERAWIAPLRDALQSGRIGMLTLHLAGSDWVLDVETSRSDLRRFWRRRRSLAQWLTRMHDADA